MAKSRMPQAPVEALHGWVQANGYHLPYILNLPYHATTERADGKIHPEFADRSIFYSRYFIGLYEILTLDFGRDQSGRLIGSEILRKAPYSLSLTIPAFLISLFTAILLAVYSAWKQGRIDRFITAIAVTMMSIALPAYLLGTTFLFGKVLLIIPVYASLIPAVLVAVLAGTGPQLRFYRTVFAEQIDAPHIKGLKLRGATNRMLLLKHVIRNSMLPVLTSVVMTIPFLITGSLLLEQFFGIPGMGDMMFNAIMSQDFKVVQSLVYVGTILYVIGALFSDIAYIYADPRVTFQ